MLERVEADPAGLAVAARLLHDFNLEYDEPSPPPERLALRLAELIAADQVVVLLARADDPVTVSVTVTVTVTVNTHGEGVGVAVMRVQPSIWGEASEAYLAELYVVPGRRGQGYGRELITGALQVAREMGADYAYLVTSADDTLAQRLYEAAGFRRTEGEGGPAMLAYERDL